MLGVGVAALGRQLRSLGGIVEVRQAGVVELEVGTAELAQGLHLGGVGGAQVVPELVEVGIDGGVDGRPPAAVVDHARRRDGQLGRHRPDRRLQEPEVVDEDGFVELHPVVHLQRRRGELEAAGLVAELDRQAFVGPAHAAELVDEVHVPRGATELAVGGRPEPDVLLHAHDRADGIVLRQPQLPGRDATGGGVGAGLLRGRGALRLMPSVPSGCVASRDSSCRCSSRVRLCRRRRDGLERWPRGRRPARGRPRGQAPVAHREQADVEPIGDETPQPAGDPDRYHHRQ